jgi:hypothetical protein
MRDHKPVSVNVAVDEGRSERIAPRVRVVKSIN